MPDRDLPPPWRMTLRVLRAVLYLCVLYAGVAALVWTPRTIEGVIGSGATYLWAGLAIAGAGGSLAGVLLDRYRVEWIAVWWAAAGVTAYAITVWTLAATETITRQTQASVCTGLLVALLYRAAELTAHAAKLRRAHHRRL